MIGRALAALVYLVLVPAVVLGLGYWLMVLLRVMK